ncbi:MAG: hypothetical protein JNM17_03895 [Archangium sp.]|nr:hypothetical protein [Archangium sp.]
MSQRELATLGRAMDLILLTSPRMKGLLLPVALLLLAGCDAPVTSTFVDGSVAGVTIPNASAVSLTDTDILGGVRRTVWIGSGLKCSDLGSPGFLNFGPSAKLSNDGGYEQLLVVEQNGTSVLDLGVGTSRMFGTTSRFVLLSAENATLTGRFVSSFGAFPDAGFMDAGTFSGDFIAPPCSAATAGCEVTPVGTFVVLALAMLRLQRARKRSAALLGLGHLRGG